MTLQSDEEVRARIARFMKEHPQVPEVIPIAEAQFIAQEIEPEPETCPHDYVQTVSFLVSDCSVMCAECHHIGHLLSPEPKCFEPDCVEPQCQPPHCSKCGKDQVEWK